MTEPGKFAPGLIGFPTPNTAADVEAYLLFLFSDPSWAQYILGACKPLSAEYNWYEAGDMLPAEASEAFRLIIEQAPYNLTAADADVDTPYWDDEGDVDDTAPRDAQEWYGEMTDPDAPPGELDFVENAALWVGTGLVALATGSVGVALAFRTFVHKFLLIQKAGDVGETIRYVIDGEDYATIDTTGHAGELMKIPVLADPSLETHQIYIVKTG